MTSREIALVQESFRKIVPIADHVAALFYVRLFELNPSLRQLVNGDMPGRGRQLVRLLGSTVGALQDIDTLRPAIRRLGARRAFHGTRDEDYAVTGTALLWTLEKVLGPEFTPPVRAAWTRFYVVLASAMLDGAHVHEFAA